MGEWLDIVNEHDIVVGKAPRSRIHSEGHFHRSSHIVLFNGSGQVFVQLRSLSKDNDAGLWDSSAAGHVDSGESYLACAIRELAEELGVQVSADALTSVCKLPPTERNGFEFAEIYAVCSEQQLTLQAEEIDDGRWCSPAALEQWMLESPEQFTVAFQVIWRIVQPTV